MARNVIDISTWQKNVDFDKVKADGIEGVIIRAGFGWDTPSQKDNMFEQHYAKAKAAGLLVGAYHYSYASNVAQAEREAYTFMDYVNGKQFDYPVYYDVEEQIHKSMSGNAIADIMIKFGEILESKGFYVGMYTYISLLNKIPYDRIKRFSLWVAQYNSTLQFNKPVAFWQYTSTGKVNGYSGNIDKNYLYEDYPNKIRKSGGNPRTSAPAETETQKLQKQVTLLSTENINLKNENEMLKTQNAKMSSDVGRLSKVNSELNMKNTELIAMNASQRAQILVLEKKLREIEKVLNSSIAGDANGDGVVDTRDALRILKQIAGVV